MAMAIVAQDIHKHYPGAKGDTGLNGFELAVPAGSVCGLLGPNGAGKTTAVRIFATLLDADSGQATVAGFHVKTQVRQVRERIGLVGQYAAVDEILTGRQNLLMFARLHHFSARQAQQRADQLLAQFALTAAATQPVSQYSGGMRRRLDLAVSLITAPPVLLVDEPTTGLDPAGRREVWQAIQALVAAGTTVLLTTQYLEEADHLADQIAILQAGRIVATGTPDELKATLGANWIDLVVRPEVALETVAPIAQQVATGALHIDATVNKISIPVQERTKALITLVTALTAAGIEPEDIALRRPTLDEVFLHLTETTQTQYTPGVIA
ncbi:MAG: ATP-binding cassette domain-containing protein [Caldilinea sp. CFX5]|nr:ATP-binding cassette domain-containing protein [Caldilinea sp. CFX5]